jgi:hypothetical protein
MQVAIHSLRVCVAKPQQVTGGWVNASTTLFSKVKHPYTWQSRSWSKVYLCSSAAAAIL